MSEMGLISTFASYVPAIQRSRRQGQWRKRHIQGKVRTGAVVTFYGAWLKCTTRTTERTIAPGFCHLRLSWETRSCVVIRLAFFMMPVLKCLDMTAELRSSIQVAGVSTPEKEFYIGPKVSKPQAWLLTITSRSYSE